MKKILLLTFALITTSINYADIITFTDSTSLSNCFVRDEGVKFSVWKTFNDVGKPAKMVPASKVESFKIDRSDPRWDVHPDLPDLSVIFIEMNPKLPGLHGNISYDPINNSPLIKPLKPAKDSHLIADIGERAYLHPEEAVKKIKFQYKPGEMITLTANVRNLGFNTSKPFSYRWKLDGKVIKKGEYKGDLKEMEFAYFELKLPWKKGLHNITFEINANQKEILYTNNQLTDPLWGMPFTFRVDPKRTIAWHQNRTSGGSFSFEDHYQYHIDLMNNLLKHSVYPSAPSGIFSRVRLDKIVYTTNVFYDHDNPWAADGIVYDQGSWPWKDDQDKTRTYKIPDKKWRNETEWSLPHELGHQLGVTDWYALDFPGSTNHLMPNGDPVGRLMRYPVTMMHWHGPQPYSEVDAAYFNMTFDQPRGYFGDYYFAIPLTNFIKVVDINGQPVDDAKIEIFQRSVVVDKKKKPVTLSDGVSYYPVIEDGDFYGNNLSIDPVVTGETDEKGDMMLPNRPAKEVKTLTGFHRVDNIFGNINVVGNRGLLLVRVTKNSRIAHFWIDCYETALQWFRGNKDEYTYILKTPFGSINSPDSPVNVKAVRIDSERNFQKGKVKVTWDAPECVYERNYIYNPAGYTVFRRITNAGLNEKPWVPVATVGKNKKEVIIDLEDFPEDNYWSGKINRFGVSTLGVAGRKSEIVETILKK